MESFSSVDNVVVLVLAYPQRGRLIIRESVLGSFGVYNRFICNALLLEKCTIVRLNGCPLLYKNVVSG